MIDIGFVNSFLEVLVKITGIVLGAYLFFLLRNLNSFIQKAEKSFESVEQSAEAVEKSIKWGKLLPFIGGKE
jgi:succinate dehydrogenase/fumarate reductase cytochrome b subunit